MSETEPNAETEAGYEKRLKGQLLHILSRPLDAQRHAVKAIAEELNADIMTCAAALLYLVQADKPDYQLPCQLSEHQTLLPVAAIKMVRYRLDVGSSHQVTLEDIKKVLVQESGVDKNNIKNVAIRELYTLIDLPDAMPPDIFQHLKTVEINQQKLDIKRVKTRNNKKRGFPRNRRRGASASLQNTKAADST
jgi:hypothetical protein